MKVNRKESSYEVIKLENEVVISNLSLEWFQGRPYDPNGHVKVTYKTFCKEPHITNSYITRIMLFVNGFSKSLHQAYNLSTILQLC
jgi:hypothetical protein